MQSRARSALTLVLAAATAALSPLANAAPTGGQTTSGAVTITGQGSSKVVVDQTTQRGVVTWSSFDTKPGEQVQFIQPNASSVTLNRVTGGAATSFFGSLTANGQVWLINPNGALFGPHAQVNVAGLLVTSADVSTAAFMSGAGAQRFSTPGAPGAVIENQGQITVQDAGMAAFVAPSVVNSGVILARYGKIALAGAQTFTLDLNGDGLLSFAPGDGGAGAQGGPAVRAGGTIQAAGGQILLTAASARQVVNQSVEVTGLVSASSASLVAGGVHLGGPSVPGLPPIRPAIANAGTVAIAAAGDVAIDKGARVDVSAPAGLGGSATVTGATIEVAGSVNANGLFGGGAVMIGGGARGEGPLQHAASTSVENGAVVTADSVLGDGGHVVLWSDAATYFGGAISADGRNGGLVETSSAGQLNAPGAASARALAAGGRSGEWLLDPYDITISNAVNANANTSGATWVATGQPGNISVSTIDAALTAGTNVTIATTAGSSGGGTIAVNASIVSNYSGAATAPTLTLNATNNLNFASGVSVTAAGNSALNMVFTSSSGSITGSGNSFVTNGGNLTMTASGAPMATRTAGGYQVLYNNAYYNGGVYFNGLSVNVGAGTATITGGVSGETANAAASLVADGVLLTGAVNLTAGTGGSIAVNGTGSWGVILGLPTINLVSNGAVTITGRSSNLTAGRGGLEIGANLSPTQPAITDQTGSLTLAAVVGGTNQQTGIGLGWAGASTFTNSDPASGVLTLQATSGAANAQLNTAAAITDNNASPITFVTGTGGISLSATSFGTSGGGINLGDSGTFTDTAGGAITITSLRGASNAVGNVVLTGQVNATSPGTTALNITADTNITLQGGFTAASTAGPLNIAVTSNNGEIQGRGTSFTTQGGAFTMSAVNTATPNATALNQNGNRSASIALIGGFNLNVGGGTAAITGTQANEATTENGSSNATPWADGLWLSGNVNLTSTGLGSITMAGTGAWGTLIGWYGSSFNLTSNGANTITGTGTGLSAYQGGVWIGNGLFTNASGTVNLNGNGGNNTGSVYATAINSSGALSFVNNGSGDLVLNALTTGTANTYSSLWIPNVTITNNGSGNIRLNGTRANAGNGGWEINTTNSTISNRSNGNIIYTSYNNNSPLGGDGIGSQGSTITNSGSGAITYNATENIVAGTTTGCCGWMADLSSSTITNSGAGAINMVISGTRNGLIIGGTYTNSGSGAFNISGTSNYTNCCANGLWIHTLSTAGNFTLTGVSPNGYGVRTDGAITNTAGTLTINGSGSQIGVLLGNGSYFTQVLNNNDPNGGAFTINGVNTSAGGNQGGVWLYGAGDIIQSSGNITINGRSGGGGEGITLDRPQAIQASSGTLTLNGTNTANGPGFLLNTNYSFPTASTGNYTSGALNGTQGTFTTSGSIAVNGTSSAGIGVQTNSTTYWVNTGVLNVSGTSTTSYGVGLGWGGGTQSFTNQNGGVFNVAGVSTSSYGLLFNGNQNFLFSGTLGFSGQSTSSSGVYLPYYNAAYTYGFSNAAVTISGTTGAGASGYAVDTKGANPVFVGDASSSLTLQGATENLASSTFQGFQTLAFAPLDPTKAFTVLGTKINFTPAAGVSAQPAVTFGSASETAATTLAQISDTEQGSILIQGGSGALSVNAITGSQITALTINNAPALGTGTQPLQLLGAISAPLAAVTLASNGAVSDGQALTAGSVAITSNGSVTDTGAVIASALSISAGGAISVTNAANQYAQVAAATNRGAITLNDSIGTGAPSLTVTSLNGVTGIQDSDTSPSAQVSLVSTGAVNISAPVSSASVGAGVASPAILISAGAGRAAGDTSTAYDLSINMAQPQSAIQVAAGGTALLYTGSINGSTNLGVVGTQGGFRYNSTPGSAGYDLTSAALTAGVDVIYRYQPVISAAWSLSGVSADSTGALSGVYKGSAYVPTLMVANTSTIYNGDTVTLNGTPSGPTALNVGTYTFSVGSVTSNLGYRVLPLAPLTFAITPYQLAVNVSGISANNKTYDGTTTANFTVSSAPTAAFLGTDGQHLQLTYAAGGTAPTGVFATPNASASAQTVTLNNLALSAASGYSTLLSDYTLSVPTFQAVISKANLQIAGVSASSKTYDGTTAATLVFADPTVTGWVGSDAGKVSVNYSNLSGVFTQKDVGTWSVNVSASGSAGFLTGPSSVLSNYNLVLPNGLTATISPLTLTYAGGVSTGSNGALTPGKVYDGTTQATLIGAPTLTGILPADKSTVKVDSTQMNGVYDSANVDNATHITVTGVGLTGLDSQDYAVPSIQVAATITPAPVGLSGLTAQNKIYDGTTAVAVSGNPILTAVLAQDAGSVSVAGQLAGVASSKDVGSGIAVSLMTGSAGVHLVGPSADNYALAVQQLSANITPKTVSLAVNDQPAASADGLYVLGKTYDGTTAASLAGPARITGLVDGDAGSVSLVSGGVLAAYRSPNAGSGAVDIAATSYSLSGAAAADYSLVLPTLTGVITPAPLSVSGLAALGRTYDGTNVVAVGGAPTLIGVVGKDSVAVNAVGLTGLLSSPNAGSETATVQGLALTGGAASNYVLTPDVLSVTITKAQLHLTGLTLAGGSKVYDGTTSAILTGAPVLQGVVASDAGSVALAGAATAAFLDPNVGVNKPLSVAGISLSGAASSNYVLAAAAITGTITPATLTYTATPATKFLGQPNPSLSGTVTGFVDGQTLDTATNGALAFTTAATLTSPVGAYAVNGGGLSAVNGDYVFVQAPGNASALQVSAPYTNSTIGLVTTLDTGLAVASAPASADILLEAAPASDAATKDAPSERAGPPATPGPASRPPSGQRPLLCVLIAGSSVGCGPVDAATAGAKRAAPRTSAGGL